MMADLRWELMNSSVMSVLCVCDLLPEFRGKEKLQTDVEGTTGSGSMMMYNIYINN